MRLLTNYGSFLNTAPGFWKHQVLPASERVILVEAMSQDLRVTLRNLTLANALRRVERARIVVYSGADEDWNQVVWTYFNADEIAQMCYAYGAESVLDAHKLVDERVQGTRVPHVVAGVDLGGPLPESAIPRAVFDQIVYATTCRMAKAPRLDDSVEMKLQRDKVEARSLEFARIYEALISNNDVVALISSHVDYDNFGLAVEAALRHDVPVIFTQSTGSLKAYTLFPERAIPGAPVRAGLTEDIGAFFESRIWANRDLLRRSAELTQSRAKATLGRPSWWRAGGGFSSIDIRDAAERSAVRTYAAKQVGLDASKPTVSVFNHAVSDALGTNKEAFADLGDWFEQTVAWAREHPEVNWLFLDHPQQDLYDATEFFDGLAMQNADQAHMSFFRSLELTKNALISLTDLVLTVRGSVSNEYPALGIPAIQCGWSEWSGCGFTTVTDSVDDYFRALEDHVEGLLERRPLITADQIERARLWAWFYRSATDIPSCLIHPWRMGESDWLFNTVTAHMLQVEADGDLAFSTVSRMWRRRDPFLTRFDFDLPGDELANQMDLTTA